MPKYKFDVRFLENREVTVEASCEDEAWNMVKRMDRNQMEWVDEDTEIDCLESDEEETGQ